MTDCGCDGVGMCIVKNGSAWTTHTLDCILAYTRAHTHTHPLSLICVHTTLSPLFFFISCKKVAVSPDQLRTGISLGDIIELQAKS